jgi:gas vesicle protein
MGPATIDRNEKECAMKRFFSFVAGLLSGSVVGAAAAILLAPASGDELRADARARWEEALNAAKEEMEQTQRQKSLEYEQMKESGKLR